MHTLVAILLSTVWNIGQPAPGREHFDIFLVSGQSNAKVEYAEGIRRAIEDSHGWTNPIILHQNHSGQPMKRWIDGVNGNYFFNNLFFADFWSTHHTSGLETLIRSIRENGDTFSIAGFFWFQGESDSGFYGEILEYDDRFRFMLDQISLLHNRGRPVPFVITAVDYNHDLEDQLEHPVKLFNFMRQTQFQLASESPVGLASDSRGWPRLDLWHIGDQSDPNGQYYLLNDFGYEQGTLFAEAFGPPPCPADISAPFRILDSNDVQYFYRLYLSLDPSADFTGDGVIDFFDVAAFFGAFELGCP
ncbi:MAG: hypothetical protein KC996_10680 [Phycisphaerales bacterium]|nr:hypothetical protein [Phycisphaerales bacterium]